MTKKYKQKKEKSDFIKIKNNLILKMCKEYEYIFLQGRYTNGQ